MSPRALAALGLVALVALGGSCGDSEAAQACVPGEVVSCPCPGGQGVQTCSDDGSAYGACEGCTPLGEAGSGGGAGGTTTSSTGGGGAGGGEGGQGGGEAGAGGGASGGGGGGSSSGAFSCVDLDALSPTIDFPACDAPDAAECLCEGCVDDGVCFSAEQLIADDCVCPDCQANAHCSNPANCQDDGVCDPYFEGCVCADCSDHPLCK